MKITERIFIGIMMLAAVGHMIGTFTRTEIGSGLFVWSLSGVLACSLLVALNIIRHARSGDKPIAILSTTGNMLWFVVVILFGMSIGNIYDPRVMIHAIAAIILSIYGFASIIKS